jgi:hypothetical protein
MPGKRKRSRRKGRSRRLDLNAPARAHALEVLSRMRTENLSLRRAAKKASTTPRTVLKYVGSALKRNKAGRYQAKASDRLTRTLNFPTEDGTIPVETRSSRTASKIAAHSLAVKRFLESGDASGLVEFEGQSIRAGKITYPFITDLEILERLGNAGEVSFEDLYAATF